MSNQLKDLNSNIQAKDKKIKSIYKTMKRVRVYYAVQVYNKETFEMVYESEELTRAKAEKVMKEAVDKYNSDFVKQLVRVQTGGYVGGIILGGSCTVIQNVAC